MLISTWSCQKAQSDDRKPLISIPELMMDKLATSNDTGKVTLRHLKDLRNYDNKLYKALYKEHGALPKKYFYSRKGSCCPCMAGGSTCCACSRGSALGAVGEMITHVVGFGSDGSMFMFTKMNSAPQVNSDTLKLDRTSIEGMDIFTVPENTKAGKYTVTLKGPIVELTLEMIVSGDGDIDISSVQ